MKADDKPNAFYVESGNTLTLTSYPLRYRKIKDTTIFKAFYMSRK